MTNTRTQEPRAYYVGALNAFTTSKDEAGKMGKQFPVESLYPAAAYEAQKAENEAQAKRIAELEKGLTEITEWTKRYTSPGHPISTVADRLLAESKNGDSK